MGCASGKSNNILNKKSSSKKNNNNIHSSNQKNDEQLDSPELAYQFIMNMRKQQQIQQHEQINELCHSEHHIYCMQKCANQRDCYLCPQISMPAESSIIRKRQQFLAKLPSDSATHVSERDRCFS